MDIKQQDFTAFLNAAGIQEGSTEAALLENFWFGDKKQNEPSDLDDRSAEREAFETRMRVPSNLTYTRDGAKVFISGYVNRLIADGYEKERAKREVEDIISKTILLL